MAVNAMEKLIEFYQMVSLNGAALRGNEKTPILQSPTCSGACSSRLWLVLRQSQASGRTLSAHSSQMAQAVAPCGRQCRSIAGSSTNACNGKGISLPGQERLPDSERKGLN